MQRDPGYVNRPHPVRRQLARLDHMALNRELWEERALDSRPVAREPCLYQLAPSRCAALAPARQRSCSVRLARICGLAVGLQPLLWAERVHADVSLAHVGVKLYLLRRLAVTAIKQRLCGSDARGTRRFLVLRDGDQRVNGRCARGPAPSSRRLPLACRMDCQTGPA
jgi:hypothetical protein